MTSSMARAWAPASVGNACVGFDVLGFSLPVAGDLAVVERGASGGPGRVEAVQVVASLTTEVRVDESSLPTDPGRNTASVALQALLDHLGAPGSFHLRLEKGIPLSAGMGGSAASAVAAVVAGNALLGEPLEPRALLPFALEGEKLASGGYHADNVAPSLLGGLTVTGPGPRPRVIRLPVPDSITCVLVHPQVNIDTRDARAALADHVPLESHVRQSAHLAFFLEGLHSGDLGLIGESMHDVVVEPQRARLIPGFQAAKKAAMDAGAMACAISGAGPSVFAWVPEGGGPEVQEALVRAFRGVGLGVDSWMGTPGGAGARLESR